MRHFHHALLLAAAALGVLSESGVALAQTAEYASPDELKPEGLSHLLDVATLGEYSRVADPDEARGLQDVGVFGLRNRLYLWRTVSHAAGLDAKIGGSNSGF